MANYLTLEEAAERLGVEYKTVYRLVRNGDIPAGKVGRIYRVREEDLEAFFERQKQLTAREAKRTGLTALEGLQCGACGSAILSELSIGGMCQDTGRPICQACWSVRKIRRCGPRRELAGGEGLPGDEQPLDEQGVAAQAAQPQTADQQDVSEQAIAKLKQAGKPVIVAAEAKLTEETFIRSFGHRLEMIETLPDPLSGQAISLREARCRHKLEKKHHGEGKLPANLVSRFSLRVGGWGKPKCQLVLEARFLSRLLVLEKSDYDAEPIGEAELSDALTELATEAERTGCFHAVLIASPTGWASAATARITKPHGTMAFRHRLMGVALYDLQTDEVFLDQQDDRLWAFWALIAPTRHKAAVSKCVETIRQLLIEKDSLSLADAARACNADASWVRAAFGELEKTDRFKIDELPDMGVVISRS